MTVTLCGAVSTVASCIDEAKKARKILGTIKKNIDDTNISYLYGTT